MIGRIYLFNWFSTKTVFQQLQKPAREIYAVLKLQFDTQNRIIEA